jgi:hypothetical protein
MSKTTDSNVARLVAARIADSGRPQRDIAREAGFDKPNVMTMIKQGHTKLPLGRVGALAKALNMDPFILFKLCMSEYHPETWKSIEPHLSSAMTGDEAILGGDNNRAMRR